MVTRATVGQQGEEYTACWLENNGYSITTRNYYSRYGEIDIIAEKDGTIAFVEVKTRKKETHSGGWDITKHKRSRIIKTALAYLQQNGFDLQPRFDVSLVVYSGSIDNYCIEYIAGAFDGEGASY